MKNKLIVVLCFVLLLSLALICACGEAEPIVDTNIVDVYTDSEYVDNDNGVMVCGLVTCNGIPVVGATVTYDGREAITMRTGQFTLRGASNLGGKLTVSKDGYYDFRYKVTEQSFVDNKTNIIIELELMAIISGKVTDSWGNAVEQVKVSCGNHVAYTDQQGNYTLQGLLVGDKKLEFSKSGCNTVTRIVRGDWFVDGKVENFDVDIHYLATLRGKITSGGVGIAGVKVQCGSAITYTDENGDYVLTGIYPIMKETHLDRGVEVEFSKDGYQSVVQIIDFYSAENFDITQNVTLYH